MKAQLYAILSELAGPEVQLKTVETRDRWAFATKHLSPQSVGQKATTTRLVQKSSPTRQKASFLSRFSDGENFGERWRPRGLMVQRRAGHSYSTSREMRTLRPTPGSYVSSANS